jgi:hypothetical protein
MTMPPLSAPTVPTSSSLHSISGLLGFFGSLRHNKMALTIYNLSIWVILAGVLAISYLSYKEVENNKLLEVNLRTTWVRVPSAVRLDMQSRVRGAFLVAFSAEAFISIPPHAKKKLTHCSDTVQVLWLRQLL